MCTQYPSPSLANCIPCLLDHYATPACLYYALMLEVAMICCQHTGKHTGQHTGQHLEHSNCSNQTSGVCSTPPPASPFPSTLPSTSLRHLQEDAVEPNNLTDSKPIGIEATADIAAPVETGEPENLPSTTVATSEASPTGEAKIIYATDKAVKGRWRYELPTFRRRGYGPLGFIVLGVEFRGRQNTRRPKTRTLALR